MPRWLDGLAGDARHALRAIGRMPLVASVIVASLGAGIGVNTIVFSWMRGVVFRPLPGVPDATTFRLVEPRTANGMYVGTSWPEFRDIQDALRTFDDLFAFRMVPLYVGEGGRLERAYALLVSGNYFPALRLRPALGRLIAPDDAARPGSAPVAVVSYDYWQSHLAGDPAAVGRALRINGQNLTIAGVAPRNFQGTILGLAFDLWVPATMAPEVLKGSRELDGRAVRGYQLMGHVRDGVNRSQAQADLDVVMARLEAAYPATNARVGAEVLEFSESPRGPQRFMVSALAVLQGLMLLLLAAVCGNTANLVLARASARQRESGVRLALGAPPWRIARLLLVENVVLGLIGSSLGGLVAWWGAGSLRAVPPLRGLPIRFQVDADLTAFAFAAILGIASGLVFGAAPAAQLARVDPNAALRAGSRTSGRSRLRYALMGIQVALAMAILIVAGLFLRSFLDTRTADTGFRRDGVLLASFDLTGRGATAQSTLQFAATLLDRLRGLPAVRNAAIAVSVPLDIHGMPSRRLTIEGRGRDDGNPDEAVVNTVTPGYFDVMGIPLLAGADFADMKLTSRGQAIVNETFVRRFLPGFEPIGKRVRVGAREYAISGVARDSLNNAFGETPTPAIYLPYRDAPAVAADIHVLTAPGSENAVAPDLRRLVAELEPGLPVYNMRTMREHIETNLVFRRIPARLFAVLGPLVLVLVAVGIYAVVSYAVSLRRTEIGVRIALGATGRGVKLQLAREHLAICAVGAMAGWLVTFVGAVDVVSSELLDVMVFAGVPVVVMVIAAAACWAAVRKTTAVDPLAALRQE